MSCDASIPTLFDHDLYEQGDGTLYAYLPVLDEGVGHGGPACDAFSTLVGVFEIVLDDAPGLHLCSQLRSRLR